MIDQQVVKHFRELTPFELYAILKLRNEVFVVEQHCAYQDLDNKDLYCYHLMLFAGSELAGYARLVPPGLSYNEMSIGRVITSKQVRGTGVGRKLMNSAINYCYQFFGNSNIQIGAQLYAKAFYESLGFKEIGDVYDEDGIDHIHMIKYHP